MFGVVIVFNNSTEHMAIIATCEDNACAEAI